MAGANPKMGLVEWTLLIVLAMVWGGSFFFAKVAVAEVPPLSIVAVRVSLAAAVLIVVVHIAGHRMPATFAGWAPFLAMGVVNNAIPFSLIFWAQATIASGLASVLNATMPIFTALIAHILTADERLSVNKVAGIVLGVVGVAVMIGAEAVDGVGSAVWAQLACVAAALSYAFASIFGRRFAGTPPIVTATGQLVSSSLIMVPVALVVDQPWRLPVPGGASIASLIALAVVATAFAYILYFRILKVAGATNVSLVTLLVPVSAILLGAVFLGERLSGEEMAGMALIGLGLIAIDGRPITALSSRLGLRRA